MTTPTSTPTPAPTPSAAPSLSVQKVGASASASGFMAFAVIANPSGETAVDVKVEITAVSDSGQALAKRTGSISQIAPGRREAVALLFPVGRTLPAQFTGSISGVRWSSDAPAEAAEVAGASFIQDARTPSVRVHVVNHGQGAARMVVIAVCWDGAGEIRGGGSLTATVGADAQGHDVTVSVSIATVPAHCDAYSTSAA